MHGWTNNFFWYCAAINWICTLIDDICWTCSLQMLVWACDWRRRWAIWHELKRQQESFCDYSFSELFPSGNASIGRSMPTRLAVNRTRSVSDMSAPGLYLSKSVVYTRWALAYCVNCFISSNCLLSKAESPCADEMTSRNRDCNGDRYDADLRGSSRRIAR